MVAITWSTTESGSAQSLFNHGTSSNGNYTTPLTIFLRHDGTSPLTNCKFYFTPKSGSYTGSATSVADFDELIAWGNETATEDFGGIQINMKASTGFDGGADWGMSQAQKTSSDGLKVTVRTGVGNSQTSGIVLAEEMSSGMSTDGEIPNGETDVSFQLRLKIPQSEDTAGSREFDQVLKFSYTP